MERHLIEDCLKEGNIVEATQVLEKDRKNIKDAKLLRFQYLYLEREKKSGAIEHEQFFKDWTRIVYAIIELSEN